MKENNAKMKCVSLPLDVFGKFRTANTELAGEVFQYILNYVVEGEQKHFTDTYKEMLFESLLEPIRPQLARYSERAEQCQEMARERTKSSKGSRKKNVKVVKTGVKVDDCDADVSTLNESEAVLNNNVTSTCNNVELSDEDVSFATFMSIYEHQDKGGFDTESVWNRLDDDEKRQAISYARSYVQEVPDADKREWPSRFLSTHPWTQVGNQ